MNTMKAGKSGAACQSLVGVDSIPGDKLFTGSQSPLMTRIQKKGGSITSDGSRFGSMSR